MKENKGFTLIELLASVVVLIIILLIAIPTINRLTDETKKKSFENSAYGLIKAGDLYYSRREMMGEELVDTLFEFPNNINGLEFSGDIPENGSMMISAAGDIVLAISNDKYCITKEYDSSDITITKDVENCTLPTMMYTNGIITSTSNCINTGTCPNGTLVNVQVNDSKTYNFYVINDTGAELTLIMSENLGNLVAWINASDYTTENNKDETPNTCNYRACNDEGPITAINYLDGLTDEEWSNITPKEYTYSGIAHDGVTRKYEDITRTMRARMLTYSEANAIKTANNGILPGYMYGGTSYWTSTANSFLSIGPYNAWKVDSNGNVSYDACDAGIGVRPVIELSK